MSENILPTFWPISLLGHSFSITQLLASLPIHNEVRNPKKDFLRLHHKNPIKYKPQNNQTGFLSSKSDTCRSVWLGQISPPSKENDDPSTHFDRTKFRINFSSDLIPSLRRKIHHLHGEEKWLVNSWPDLEIMKTTLPLNFSQYSSDGQPHRSDTTRTQLGQQLTDANAYLRWAPSTKIC